jgi:general secretion pathway protein K
MKFNQSRQQGLALILVLMISAMIAVVVIMMQYKARAALQLAEQARNFTLARAKVESAREELIYVLTTTPVWITGAAKAELELQQLPTDFNLAGTEFIWNSVRLRLSDSGGKIAILPFNEIGWRQLLESQGVESTDPIIDSIKDWIDEDDLTHLYGAEARDYAVPGLPRNQQPQFEEEMRYVLGMPEEVWHNIRPFLTLIGYEAANPYFMPDRLMPILMGPLTADMMRKERKEGVFSEELASVLRTDEETFYPSKRLEIEIRAEVGLAAYSESFILIREQSADRISHVTKKQPGYEWTEVMSEAIVE